MQSVAAPELLQPTDIVCPHPNCGLSFGSLRTLKKHHDLHTTGASCIKCSHCSEVFADLALYEKHWRSKTCGASSQVLPQPSQLPRMESEPPASKRRRETDRPDDSVADSTVASAAEAREKEKLAQHLATVAMRNTQHIYMCQQRESDLVLGLEECSLTLDRALHMIMVMSGGNLNNIPIDMQLTSLKYSANRRQIHPPAPPAGYGASSASSDGEASPVVLFNNTTHTSSSSSSSQLQHEIDSNPAHNAPSASANTTQFTHPEPSSYTSPPHSNSTGTSRSASAHPEH